MEFAEALATRQSCRAFRRDPIPEESLATVLAAARRGPSAGNTWALDLVVLDRREDVDGYWGVTLPELSDRGRFTWPGLLVAPVLVVVAVRPAAYIERYAASDKARTDLGAGESAWTVPYWWVDAGASIMAVLLAATAAGLGSLLFGVFDHEPALKRHFGVPGDRRIVGTIALGFPDPAKERRSSSSRRPRPDPSEFVHRGRW